MALREGSLHYIIAIVTNRTIEKKRGGLPHSSWLVSGPFSRCCNLRKNKQHRLINIRPEAGLLF